MADIKYDILEELGVLSESAKGWKKELNLISWNGEFPNMILEIAPQHEKMGKRITLSKDEIKELYDTTYEEIKRNPNFFPSDDLYYGIGKGSLDFI